MNAAIDWSGLGDALHARFKVALAELKRAAATALAERVEVRGASPTELAALCGDGDEHETTGDETCCCGCCAPGADAAPGHAADDERGPVERDDGERARTRRGKRGGRKHGRTVRLGSRLRGNDAREGMTRGRSG
ncbi:MAG: hypothetical protein HRF50_15085 [Phycisphaerae bacterium]